MHLLPLGAALRSRLSDLLALAAGFTPADGVRAELDPGRIALRDATNEVADAVSDLAAALPAELERRFRPIETHFSVLRGAVLKLGRVPGPEDRDGGRWQREAARSELRTAARGMIYVLDGLERWFRAKRVAITGQPKRGNPGG